MNKGINIEIAKQILEKSNKVGIKNICWFIVGFPGETKKDFDKTVEFITENNKNISLSMLSRFELLTNTYLYCHPKEFGIKLGEVKYNTPTVPYEIDTGLTRVETEALLFDLLAKKREGKIKLANDEYALPDFNVARMILFKIASTGKI